jgi:hypothetical protein
MTTIINGSSPSITFSDSTTQASAGLTAASPTITSGVLTFPDSTTQSTAGLTKASPTIASGVLTFANSSTQTVAAGLGSGSQTWQDVTSSRSLSTNYTNSTGYPIMVAFITTSGTSAVVTVGSTQVTSGGAYASAYGTMFVIIPNGAVYSISAGNKQTWCELR